jgi:hypothetical protein
MHGKTKVFLGLTLALAAGFLAAQVALQGCSSSEGTTDGGGGGDGSVIDSGTPDGGQHSSRSYKGHATEVDPDRLVNAYPKLVGTRLDDCQTCHTGGTVQIADAGTYHNQCNFCHDYALSDPRPVGAPASFEDTLNGFGKAYLTAGRKIESFKLIEQLDSDNDTYKNIDEINGLFYPGDLNSHPGQPVAPSITLNWDQITGMTYFQQFLMMNANRQLEDTYNTYQGVKLIDLLNALGVDLTAATGVTVLAADGFEQAYTMDQVKNGFTQPTWYSELQKGGTKLGDKGFVVYADSSTWPSGLTDEGPIPGDHYLMIAYKRDGGQLLEPGYLDAISGKIMGEGPYRSILPQAKAGRPDRGSKETPVGDGYDYDKNLDHNAGACAKVVVAIRVDPMPTGYEPFDWVSAGGWAYVNAKQLVVYGTGVTAK